MKSEIKDTHRRIEINDVRDIIVTEVVTADGKSVRSIRILGEPVVSGNPTEIVELIVSSETASDIEFSAPGFDY